MASEFLRQHCADTGLEHHCPQVSPKLDTNHFFRQTVHSRQSHLDVTDRTWPTYRVRSSISKRMVSLGEQPIEWERSENVVPLQHRRVDREVAPEVDRTSCLCRRA